MALKVASLKVEELKLDLKNYRTRETTSEIEAIHALIALKPHYFWGLMRSLIEDGYHGNESIVVLKSGADHIVREGNRRISAMKLIHGMVSSDRFELPLDVVGSLASLPPAWKTDNEVVPCCIFEANDAAAATRLVRLTHARGEEAGRLVWGALARSRYEREENNGSEPWLDLLENFLKHAKNISDAQREEWGGDYQITVLKEALQKVAKRLNYLSANDLVDAVPKNADLRKTLWPIVHDIGTGKLETRHVREAAWGQEYGLPPAPSPKPSASGVGGGASTSLAPAGGPAAAGASSTTPPLSGAASSSSADGPPFKATRKSPRVASLTEPKSVKRELRAFQPTAKGAEKVVTLRDELLKMAIDETPIAFCIVLRSMFELSARAYCKRANLSAFDTKGGEKSLEDLLGTVGNHLATTLTDPPTKKKVAAAVKAVCSKSGVLAVTLLNGLVHAPNHIITADAAIAGFHAAFPLMVEMNP